MLAVSPERGSCTFGTVSGNTISHEEVTALHIAVICRDAPGYGGINPPWPCISFLLRLEIFRRQLVAGQQLVEISSIPLGKTRRLAHVATRDLQDLGEVVTGKFVASLVERGQASGTRTQC